MYNLGSFALLHPIVVFSVGLAWALKRKVRLDRVAMAVGYLIGAEVLWRMAKVPVPWEFGKYGGAVILIAALVTRNLHTIPPLAWVYFVALIPACLFPFIELSLTDARSTLSSHLSGPFFLAISCWFFANLRTTVRKIRTLFLVVLMPLLSVASATLFYTVTAEEIYFDTESNFATSGGFGPNQVSAMLGLGMFIAICCVINFRLSGRLKAFLGTVAVFFAAQSVMTFSRSGVYNAAGAVAAVILFRLRDTTEAAKRLIPVLGLTALFVWFVFPALDSFTGGKLLERFEDTGTTNRVELVQSDFGIFFEYPILGVGVGLGNEYRRRLFGSGAGSHTEFSRLISEHGLLGCVALFSLGLMVIVNLRKQRSMFGRALVAGVAVWCAFFMLNAGMRLAAPSFFWGLTFITIANPRRFGSNAGRLEPR